MKLIAFITLLYSLILLGCASSGREIQPEDISKLKEGMSIQDVELLLGLPEHISPGEEGKFYYLYYHGSVVGFMGASQSETHMLNLTFDSSGILVHIDNQTIHKASKPFGSSKTTQIDSQNETITELSSPEIVNPVKSSKLPKPESVESNSERSEEKYRIIRLYVSGEISKEKYRELMDDVR